MMHITKQFYTISVLILLFFFTAPLPHGAFLAYAQDNKTANSTACHVNDDLCIWNNIKQAAEQIKNTHERDKAYRELAKGYTRLGKIKEAISLIEKIDTPDTKAMTIRGIGMEIADMNLPAKVRSNIFKTLRQEAEKITHPPSYAIALTYIAMAQAFAGDNQGAWDTAADMKNDSLRNKAYGETAEIQAENGDYKNAKISIGKIDSPSYKNKAYATISKILVNKGMFEQAYDAALSIANPYKKILALEYLLENKKRVIREKNSAKDSEQKHIIAPIQINQIKK